MIKAGEIGKQFVYATGYDLSAKTSLEIHITKPDGTMVTVVNARLSISATPINDADLGTIAGNTYMLFLTQATDFPVAGTYTVCGVYNDATPRTYYGEHATVEVGEGC